MTETPLERYQRRATAAIYVYGFLSAITLIASIIVALSS